LQDVQERCWARVSRERRRECEEDEAEGEGDGGLRAIMVLLEKQVHLQKDVVDEAAWTEATKRTRERRIKKRRFMVANCSLMGQA